MIPFDGWTPKAWIGGMVLLVGFGAAFGQGEPAAPDESQEPVLAYSLMIDGKSFPIVEGVPLRLAGSFKDPEVTLVGEPHRVFPFHGIRFKYRRRVIRESAARLHE